MIKESHSEVEADDVDDEFHFYDPEKEEAALDGLEQVAGSFHGYDPRVIELLPLTDRVAFPFMVTSKLVILTTIIESAMDNLIHGKGVTPTQDAIKQEHFLRYTERELFYYDMFLKTQERIAKGTLVNGNATLRSSDIEFYLSPPEDFGTFNELSGYCGHVPSVHYLESAVTKYMTQRMVYQNNPDRGRSAESCDRGIGIPFPTHHADNRHSISHAIVDLTSYYNPHHSQCITSYREP